MTILEVTRLNAGYGAARVLHDINLSIGEKQVVTVLGANGAGKTTLLRAVSGLIRGTGHVEFTGTDVSSMSTEARARLGLGHVPEGRGTFGELTVAENLRVGGQRLSGRRLKRNIERMYELFPRLAERRWQQALKLSGGEQQMLAIARALIPEPSLLLLDEPSLGLAPNTTRDVFAALHAINRTDSLAMVIVEQNAQLSLEIADFGHVLEGGRIVASGTAKELRADDSVQRAYLGY